MVSLEPRRAAHGRVGQFGDMIRAMLGNGSVAPAGTTVEPGNRGRLGPALSYLVLYLASDWASYLYPLGLLDHFRSDLRILRCLSDDRALEDGAADANRGQRFEEMPA